MAALTQIQYDFSSGRLVTDDWKAVLGCRLMRICARATRRIDYVGFSYLASGLRALFPFPGFVAAAMEEGFEFRFPYGDAYWSTLLDNRRTYEPEIEAFLRSLAEFDYVFIDCGANFGYFSALVSSPAYGGKKAIAIEADPGNFDMLQANARANGDRFATLDRAIYSRGGMQVSLGGEKHESRHIVSDDGGAGQFVETIALSDLAPDMQGESALPIVKLDVEGVEIDAFQGMDREMQDQCLLIYEDHGSDPTHEISQFLVDQGGFRLFHLFDGCSREIDNLSELARIKKNPRVGYDFLATRNPAWVLQIESYGKR